MPYAGASRNIARSAGRAATGQAQIMLEEIIGQNNK